MRFKILHTNDIHSNFENFSKISTKIKELKDENTLILDAGDFHDFKDIMLEGTKGIAGGKLLLEVGYEAIAIGNNEGFAGLEILEAMTNNTNLPFLSCNLVHKNHRSIRGVKRSIIINKSRVRFLIIGTSPDYGDFFNLFDMDPLDYKEEILKEISENKGKYDVCILLSHLGLIEDEDIANTIDEVDIIISGHTHKLMEKPLVVKNTAIHISGCYGEHLGILEFDYDGQVSNFKGVNVNIENIEKDKSILDIIENSKKIANANLSKPLYSINKDMWHDVVEENPITNLLADAIKDIFDSDIGLINSGIMNSGVVKGDVSLKKLIEICPSPLNPTYMKIQGKYIKNALQQSLDSQTCYLDGRGSGFRGSFLGRLHISGGIIEHDGESIGKIIINGEELESEKYYSVATSDYLQRGTGYKDLSNNIDERYRPEYLKIVLMDYLGKDEYLKNAFVNRWIRV
ncbi:MAG: bifunctional metallophosphatase/5'-nucleotidase [Paraclostridium sp.]|uniref:bifunctional metallophosphatase/5'-nucleotidase n=1 Tax=Paraclostridium sp. TaxID=2023273 RepID=UPI003F38215E